MPKLKREVTMEDKPCEICGHPMIGIMRESDLNSYKAPRQVCVACEKGIKEGKI